MFTHRIRTILGTILMAGAMFAASGLVAGNANACASCCYNYASQTFYDC